ncbi:SIR2 family protein [Pseudoalteromonas rubra]|uniref:SIR2 family protein n=1 Tax=Pseudoalteromonas rubra TaxID=43658 RepID=UPI002DBB86CC|nr:SIR2 family protein [Pseudoalteromonas rubra]MEC4089358.1 SIR2 family protein [Pseudoalteromonas rubra]
MSLLNDLAEDFNQDTILFIGSGVSAPSGLPSWWTLVSWLRDFTNELGGDVDAANAFLDEKNLLSAACALMSELEGLGKSLTDFFNDEMCDIFRSANPQKIHELIALLPTSSIITPNYDVLLEKTYKAAGSQLQVVHKGERKLLNCIVRGKLKDYIYKYHGCITKPEKIVLGFKQYNSEKYGLSIDMEILKNLIQAKTFVFIGAGLNDPDFDHVRDYLIHVIEPQNIEFWAFMRNCEAKVNYYKKEYGINLISYTGEGLDHSDLLNKLEELLIKISCIDERKAEAVEFISSDVVDSDRVHGTLRETLVLANEEVIPLDEQILGFVAFFDTVEKDKCYRYLHAHKGNDLDEVSNRIDYLVNRKLLKATDHFLLNVKDNYSIEAAEQVEDDIMEYLMEKENG